MFIFTIIASWFISKTKEYKDDSPFYRFLLYSCIKITLFFGRVHIHSEGLERIPSDSRYVIAGNHRSNFDPILLFHLRPKDNLIFLSKPENYKFPCFGRIMNRIGCLPIDRENPRNAMKTIMKASERITSDMFSVGIYPEGTRNRTEEPLLEFHNGLFKIAQRAKVPLVIVAERETRKIYKNFPWKHTDVFVEVVDVLSPEQVITMKTSEIGEYARKAISEALKRGN